MQLLDQLNPPQREAVTHGAGPLLVFAGAGSGKTRVITFRVAHLVRTHGVPPFQILAVTFTNKAAGEMRSRVGRLLGEGFRDAWIGTFHATCARLLRSFAAEARLKRDFVIYDDGDQKAMVTRCLRDLSLDEKRFAPKAIQGRINGAKQACIGPTEYAPGDYFEDQVRKVYALYDERMAAAGALDFADLLYRMVRLLEAEPRVAAELQRRFRHLLVDEFQDTNHVQYRLLRALIGPERNLAVVGDDDQSIYRWRGADVRNILGFQKDFPDARVVTLEQNYRSSGRILRAAVSVIKKNRTRAPKTLWTDNPDGQHLELWTLESEREEGSFVVGRVRQLAASGRSAGDLAVFYRINAQARVIEEALRAANVPYRVVGGMRFYERAEVKDVIAYLRVIHNPDDVIDLVRIVNSPPRGIGAASVERLQGRAASERCSLWEALGRSVDDPAWPAATRKRLGAFRDLVAGLRQDATSGVGVAELAATVLDRTGYLEALRAQDSAEADARIENLRELVGSFEVFEAEADDPSLPALLERVSLQQDTDDLDDEGGKVTLMTVHSAKGLEFPVVVLTGMEEKVFPYESRDSAEEPEQLEEERRLCYVAITRARERLVLTNVVRRRLFGLERWNPPSRFLSDLPEDCVEVHGAALAVPPWEGRPRYGEAPRWAARKAALPEGSGRPGQDGGRGGLGAGPRVVLDPGMPPPAADDPTVGDGALRAGRRVRHAVFGVGKVLAVDQGMELKATVQFEGGRRKTILARFLSPA